MIGNMTPPWSVGAGWPQPMSVGNYSQQNLGMMMPWAVHTMPMFAGGGFSQANMIGMPAQNLAMFGQAAQQPLWQQYQPSLMHPALQQQQPLTGQNYLSAILQAINGVQRPALNISPGVGTMPSVPNAMPQSSPPILSLGQLMPPPAATAPAPGGVFGGAGGGGQPLGFMAGGNEAGGVGSASSADAAAAAAGGMDVGSAHDTGQTELAAGASGGLDFGGGGNTNDLGGLY